MVIRVKLHSLSYRLPEYLLIEPLAACPASTCSQSRHHPLKGAATVYKKARITLDLDFLHKSNTSNHTTFISCLEANIQRRPKVRLQSIGTDRHKYVINYAFVLFCIFNTASVTVFRHARPTFVDQGLLLLNYRRINSLITT